MTDATDLAGMPDAHTPVEAAGAVRRGFSRRRRIALSVGAAVVLVLGGVWVARNSIATQVIDRNLAALDLPARYEIESIGPGLEVLRHVVIGDPRHPDLTIDRLELRPAYSIYGPRIGRLRIDGARLFGRYTQGKLSFGALDKVIFAPSTAPFRLPDWQLDLVDARGLLSSEYGQLAFKTDGSGALRDGFAGKLALLIPQGRANGCSTGRASYYADVSISGEKPRLSGPLRVADVRCAAAGLATADTQARLAITADKDFGGFVIDASARTNELALGDARANALTLDAGLAWRAAALSGRVSMRAERVRQPRASLGSLGIDGLIHAREGFSTLQVRGTVSGDDIRHGPLIERTLADAGGAAAGTLFAPVLAKARAALAHEEPGSRMAGEFSWKSEATLAGQGWSLTMPELVLRGRSGQRLLQASRLHVAATSGAPLQLAGEFATGGSELPQVFGRVDRDTGSGGTLVRARLEPYGVGADRIGIPELTIRPAADGSLALSGSAQASGAIPGGSIANLALPIDARISQGGELALWSHCVAPSFDHLVLGTLALEGQRLTLCPAAAGTAIVRAGSAGLRVAGAMPSLRLTGMQGENALALTSGPVTLAYGGGKPGQLSARQVMIDLGRGDATNHLHAETIDAQLGSQISGHFAGLDARLAVVPANVTKAVGQWQFVDGRLAVTDAAFDVADREKVARFEPLHSKGATLQFLDNRVEADVPLLAPKTGQDVLRATIRHDLSSGVGHADLLVSGLKFEDRKDNSGLQPADLSKLALGVVANTVGTIAGRGRVDWHGDKLTSNGRFGTTGLDLAAAFGPVKGVSGTLDFTDLIGVVTAPHQVLKVASINPGIEVNDGIIDLQLLPDRIVSLNSARWPFLGGRLSLEPADLHLAATEVRRFTLVIDGLDAAKFLERMELSNLAATGVFDGKLPLEFDGDKGRIVGGNLVSRAPGGTVAYVGALTYKDLSPMANYAFAALKSMDYRTMVIAMQGDLSGEIVTNVKFSGIKQGNAASKNFVTRQIASLPIQFNVNIRAPFLQLITSVKAMYDPAAVRDPRTLGLVDAQGRAVHHARAPVPHPATKQTASLPPAEAGIQPSVIGSRP